MPAGAVRRVFVPEQVDNFLVDAQDLGVCFTRSATLPYIRETMKQIEAKWAS